jgi:hypothetical protein
VQLFPERDHRSRRFLALALVLSLLVHFAGGSLWALLARSVRTLKHEPEQVARTEPITIERLRPPSPTPVPTPEPTPRPRVAQNRPHATRLPPAQQAPPRRRETPRLVQPTFAPNPEPTTAPRIAKIHVPRAQRVAMVRVPHGSRGAASKSGAIDVGALDAQFRQTIAQAQHDVATTPQPAAAVSTMKRYDRYLMGNIDDVTGANGSCDPLDDGSNRGGYIWYYLRCTVRYADGYVESVTFPWPFKFTRANDPFYRHDGRRHEFPGQPPPPGFVLPHPFALTRAVCTYYREECKAVIDRERANGDAPAGSE